MLYRYALQYAYINDFYWLTHLSLNLYIKMEDHKQEHPHMYLFLELYLVKAICWNGYTLVLTPIQNRGETQHCSGFLLLIWKPLVVLGLKFQESRMADTQKDTWGKKMTKASPVLATGDKTEAHFVSHLVSSVDPVQCLHSNKLYIIPFQRPFWILSYRVKGIQQAAKTCTLTAAVYHYHICITPL